MRVVAALWNRGRDRDKDGIARKHAVVHALGFDATRSWITARELERWLPDAGLAERDGGPDLLVPTARAIALAGALEFLG